MTTDVGARTKVDLRVHRYDVIVVLARLFRAFRTVVERRMLTCRKHSIQFHWKTFRPTNSCVTSIFSISILSIQRGSSHNSSLNRNVVIQEVGSRKRIHQKKNFSSTRVHVRNTFIQYVLDRHQKLFFDTTPVNSRSNPKVWIPISKIKCQVPPHRHWDSSILNTNESTACA